MNIEERLYLESVVSLFMVEDSITKVMLIHKLDEPYKGYWMLPKKIVTKEQNAIDTTKDLLEETVGYSELYINEVAIFSNPKRNIDDRVVGVSYIALTDPVTTTIKFKIDESLEYQWFDINSLPKLAYDHEEIISKSIENLKSNVTTVEVLKTLYPGDFTLPELQRCFEKLLNITIDRRNFRKKLLNLEWIIETDHKSDKRYGRPSKIYYFVDNMKNRIFFDNNNNSKK